MPPGHFQCVAISPCPSLSRRGQPGMFSARAERLLMGLAAQAAVGIDNSRLYQTSVREVARDGRPKKSFRS